MRCVEYDVLWWSGVWWWFESTEVGRQNSGVREWGWDGAVLVAVTVALLAHTPRTPPSPLRWFRPIYLSPPPHFPPSAPAPTFALLLSFPLVLPVKSNLSRHPITTLLYVYLFSLSPPPPSSPSPTLPRHTQQENRRLRFWYDTSNCTVCV
jgi:hypothetical protein